MNHPSENPPSRDPRQLLSRANLSLPRDHVRVNTKRTTTAGGAPPAAASPASTRSAVVSYLRIKSDLHQQLLTDLDRRNLISAGEEQLAEVVEEFVDQALQGQDLPLNDSERRQLVDDLLEETLGVGPLAPLLADPAVTDVLVNGPWNVYIERFGHLERPTCVSGTPSTWCGSFNGSQPGWAGGSTRRHRWSTRACRTAAASMPPCRR
jgi:pilus assembly protein CpaF